MFEAALTAAGCEARNCGLIGYSEVNDVEPALGLGMTVIRVAIQEPPTQSLAHHLAGSLGEADRFLREASTATQQTPPAFSRCSPDRCTIVSDRFLVTGQSCRRLRGSSAL